MTGWTIILSVAATWEARALLTNRTPLSEVIRLLPIDVRRALWVWLGLHFLRERR